MDGACAVDPSEFRYMEKNASEYIANMADEAIYEQSPYSEFSRRFQRQLCASEQISPRSVRLPSRRSNSSHHLVPTAKCHNFTSFSFTLPHYCDYCRNFLWGLVQQGMRCADCGFAAHKK